MNILKRIPLFMLMFISLSSCVTSSISVASASSSFADVFVPTSYRMDYKTAREASGYKSSMPATGTVNMLIIPVTFSDYGCAVLPGGCDKVRADITTAFFGASEDTGWESVTSFYEQSSYGALNLTGEVTDWYQPSVSAQDLATNDNFSIISNVMRPAITWYRETYVDELTRFDADSDGYIDALYFVYTVPANATEKVFLDEDLRFWAYTVYDNAGVANYNRPGVFHFGWSSYDFMYKDGYYDRDDQGRIIRDENDEPVFHPWVDEFNNPLIDAHTFIHELGHFLGLPDFYSYDADDGDWGSLGMLDMMDYNVGDHHGFTKSVLGWVYPKVINAATTFTIAPLVTGHEVAMIPLPYRDTLLDEYLLVEYYRPDSLNQKDATLPFAGRYPRQFSIPGVKIYHVDARVGRFTNRDGSWYFRDYVDFINGRTTTTYYGIANSNTSSRSAVPYHKLIHLLEQDGRNTLRHGYVATNSALFLEGQAFNEFNFPDFRFNSGTSFPYNISVDQLTETAATITVTLRS